MPQVYTSRGNQVVNRGASVLGQEAFLRQGEKAADRIKRNNEALSKTIQSIQKMHAPEGSEITIDNGKVDTNHILETHMRSKTVDKSRDARSEFKMNALNDAINKSLNALDFKNATKGNQDAYKAMNQQALDAAIAKVTGGFSNSNNSDVLNKLGSEGANGGNISDISTSSSSSFSGGANLSKQLSINNAGISAPGTDYLIEQVIQQKYDDNYKQDTASAMAQSLLSDVIATASGKEYKPQDDVFLQQALNRDREVNQVYQNDAMLNKLAFDRGAEAAITADGGSVGLSEGYNRSYSESDAIRTGVSAPTNRPGIGQFTEYNETTGKHERRLVKLVYDDNGNAILPRSELSNKGFGKESLDDVVATVGMGQDRSWWASMFGADAKPINSYEDMKNNERYWNEARNRPTDNGMNLIGYGVLRKIYNNDKRLANEAARNGQMKIRDGRAFLEVEDKYAAGNPKRKIEIFIDNGGKPKFNFSTDISTGMMRLLDPTFNYGDANNQSDTSTLEEREQIGR